MNELPETVRKYASRMELQTGDYFVREGQYSKYIGYVESGLLHAYQIDHKGEMITTNFFQPGSFCGSFFSFYKQQPSFENIRALTPVSLYFIGFDTLQELFKKDLAINQLGRIAIEEVCIAKDIRLSKMLKFQAKERYLWFMKTYPLIIEMVALKHIASYLGMKPESLSRIRKELIS